MTTNWRTVRVFISSTFRDMHAERDHLVKLVFPELRERCAKRHLHVVDVDLRWGVTQEQAEMGKALEVCLHEIDSCRPFFVGILGERYGYIPPQYEVSDEPAYDWARQMEPGHSITAMEIYHGVLNNPNMHRRAFFYFRDPSFKETLSPDEQESFKAESPESAEKLERLKARIRESGLPVKEFSRDDLECFGNKVLEDLWSAIQAEYPEDMPVPDPLDLERAYHDFFIATRTELFVGQRHLLKRLHEYAKGDRTGPVIVSGTPGSGKSALLAKFVDQVRKLNPDTPIMYHFVGASPASTDPRQMLLRLCKELAKKFNFEEEIAQDFEKLRVQFQQFLNRAAESQRIIFVIDALNQLDETYHSHDLYWLPHPLPAGLRLIVSSLEGDALESAQRGYSERQELIVSSLRLADQGFIVARQLGLSRKRLTTIRQWRKARLSKGLPAPVSEERSQLRFILTGVWKRGQELFEAQAAQRETANPLYLKLVTEELRLFGRFEQLDEFIGSFPSDVDGMFNAVLNRLERDHGRELVENALSLIGVGRHGLLESELLELLAREGQQRFPVALWARLHRSLGFYLKPRTTLGGDEGLIDFFHRQLAKVVNTRYLSTEESRTPHHRQLAEYFRKKADPLGDSTWFGDYPRGLSELPYHQTRAEMWYELERTLTDYWFVEAKVLAKMVFELAWDYETARNAIPTAYLDADKQSRLEGWMSFIMRGTHSLTCLDEPFLQLAYNYTDGGPVAAAAQDAAVRYGEIWLRHLNRPKYRKDPACLHILLGHTHHIDAVAVTPDGQYAISGGHDRTLYVWDLKSGQCLRTLRGHTAWIYAVAVTFDGQKVISADRAGVIRVWDLESGKLQLTLQSPEYPVCALAAMPDGLRAISGSYSLRVWDLVDGQCLQTLEGPMYGVLAIAITADARLAVAACRDDNLWVWDLYDGKCLHILKGHTGTVNAVAVTPNGQIVVSGGSDGTIRLWDLARGECLRVLAGHTEHLGDVGDHTGGVTGVAVMSNGVRMVSSGADGTLRIWTFPEGQCVKTFEGHKAVVDAIAAVRSGLAVVSASRDRTLRVWDLAGESEGPRKPVLDERYASEYWLSMVRGQGEQVESTTVMPSGDRILVGTSLGSIKLWDLRTGRLLNEATGRTGGSPVTTTPDGQRAVAGHSRGGIGVWDLRSFKCLTTLEWHESEVRAIAAMPDNQRIICGGANMMLGVWNVASRRPTHTWRADPESNGTITAVALTPDGLRMIAGSMYGRLKVWDLESAQLIHTLGGHDDYIYAISVTPDGEMVVSASRDKTLKIWDLESGRIICSLDGHSGPVTTVAVTQDGKLVVSGSGGGDNTVRVWSLEEQRELARFVAGENIVSVATLRDNIILAVGPYEGNFYFLALENIVPGPPVVTAWKRQGGSAKLFSQWTKERTGAFCCPLCRKWFQIPESIVGSRLSCPGCDRVIKINPFTINSDWRSIAKAWRGKKD